MIFLQLPHPRRHQVRIAFDEAWREPTLLRRAGDRRNPFHAQDLQSLPHPLTLGIRAASHCAQQHQAIDAIRMLQCQRLGDHAAEGKTHDMSARNARRIEHVDRVAHEVIHRAATLDVARPAMPSQIQLDRPKIVCQRRSDRIPARPVCSDAMDQQHRRPAPFVLVEQ